jgi:uncharacterized protein
MNSDFYRAIQDGNIFKLRIYAKNGFDINSHDYLYAGAKISVEVVTELLKFFGVDINKPNQNVKYTALMNAAMSLKTDILKVFLDAGANKDLTDCNGNTALMVCSSQGVVNSMRMLLDYGADFKIKNNEKRNALMLCAEQSQIDAFQLLLDCGSDLLSVDINGSSIISTLCMTGNIPALLQYCEKAQEKNALELVLEELEAIDSDTLTNATKFKLIINSLLIKDKLENTLNDKKKVKPKKI